MRHAAMALLTLALLALGQAWSQELPLRPYSYVEGFETNSPALGLWASNGSAPEAHFNGATEERAFEGKRSHKLDVTLGDGSYYYFGFPLRVPCAGALKISARVLVAEGTTARVGFGVNVVFPPSSHSGCGFLTSFEKPIGDWQLVTGDLVALGKDDAAGVLSSNTATLSGKDVGVYLDRWTLFLYGTKGQRAVVYLDDVRVEGTVPSDDDYQKSLQANWAKATGPFRQRVQEWRARFDQARQGLQALGQAPPEAAKLVTSLRANEKHADELLTQMDRAGYASSGEINALQAAIVGLRSGPVTVRAVTTAVQASRPLLAFSGGNAVSYPRRAGEQALLGSAVGTALECAACRGEYESLSAVVYALHDLPALRATVSDLRGPAGMIPASAVDLRVVKWWYQGASGSIGYSPKKVLLPELLLKDDALVRVDADKQDNTLRSTRPDGSTEYLLCSGPDSANLANVRPFDAQDLQPVDLPAQSSREFWVTVHVPAKAAAGTYAGRITFTSAAGTTELPLTVKVHPFDLEPSRLIYSIYYRASLSPDGQPKIDSDLKSEAQYRAEIADMAAHGVLYPANYQARGDDRITRMLQIRKEMGLPAGRFYNLGAGAGPQQTPEQLAQMLGELKAWMALLKPYGYDQVYFYGTDEATGDALTSQKRAWKAAQEIGAKTFVACYRGTFEAMGPLLSCAVLAGAPDPEEARKWHSVGSEAFCYANPQVGVEDPLLYRRNFGLLLWQNGFDGAMDYAYQHAFGHIWDDFDDHTYRDHVFAYPTMNGVVDTIEWEGFREGVDDVRYATTLEKAIAQAAPKKPALAQQAQAWLKSTDLSAGDLDQTRAQMVDWIVKLRG